MTIRSAEGIWIAGNAETSLDYDNRSDEEVARRQAAEKARERLKNVFGVQEVLPLPPLTSHYPSVRDIGFLSLIDQE